MKRAALNAALVLIVSANSNWQTPQKNEPHTIKGITFVSIPGGTFQMGDTGGDEKPVHTVTVSGVEMSA